MAEDFSHELFKAQKAAEQNGKHDLATSIHALLKPTDKEPATAERRPMPLGPGKLSPAEAGKKSEE